MCLAVPARLIEVDAQLQGFVDAHSNKLPVNCVMVPDAVPGDWLLIHAGFAIHRLSEQAVRKTWDLLEDLERRVEEDSHAIG